jgi:cytochrome c553
VDRGARIATRGIPSQQVPRCAECHGPAAHDRNPAYPILAGQLSEYLELQLGLFADGRRGGTPYAHIMQRIARQLTPPQMSDVADYYASLSARDAR